MNRNSYKFGPFLLLSLASLMLLVGCGSSSDDPAPDAGDTSTMSSKISVDPLTRLVSAEIIAAGFTSTNAHIHTGAPGVSGGAIVQLIQDATDANKWASGDGARLTEAQYADYLAGNTYFNSHSEANPSGEVRTQIDPITLDISNVVIDGTTGAASGFIVSGGFTATVAHIHTGFAGSTGAPAVTLEADATTAGRFNLPVGASVTVTDYNAGQLYFNVHSADFPSGHIRAQIVPAGIQVLDVEINGTQVVPSITGGGTATAYITVNETTGAVDATLNLHNITNSTNAHIHNGVAGVAGAVAQGFTGAAGDTTWTISGETLSTGTGSNLEALLNGETYVNVHTVTNGGGEARGQIVPSGVAMARVVLTAAEASATNASGTSAGTATGYVTVNKNVSPATMQANISYSGVTASNAHVHTDNGGGVVLDLAPAGGSGSGSGTLTATQLTEFETDQFYINLHTAANPGGELRGQVLP